MKKIVLASIFVSLMAGFVFLNCAPVKAAAGDTGQSKIIPECLLLRDTKAMKAAGCDNINIFIWVAINAATYLFGFIGALALLFFVYGGVVLIISQGNQEKIKQGTSAMTAAVIGLVIAFSAYALVTFIGNSIGLTAEKSINMIETVHAQEAEGQMCNDAQGCNCVYQSVADEPPECVWIPVDQGCNGYLVDESCETFNSSKDEELRALLNVEVGAKKETPGENVSVLVAATKKLNKLNISGPSDLMRRAINAMLAFIGSIALILYIYAGFLWMSAAGNAEKLSKAKNIMIWTALGMVAMGASYMIILTIIERAG